MRLPAILLATTFLGLAPGAQVQGGTGGPITHAQGRQLAGLVVWYKADAGVEHGLGNEVTRWRNLASGDHDLVQPDGTHSPVLERYAIGGMPALRFDGNDFLASPSGMPLRDYTKVVVLQPEDFALPNNVIAGEGGHALLFDGGDQIKLAHDETFATSSTSAVLGQPLIVTATFDEPTGSGRIYQDGVLVATGTRQGNVDAALQVGAQDGAECFAGLVSEVLVFDRALTAAERGRVEAYLQNRYFNAPPRPDVTFTKLPRHGQILPRSTSGLASIQVEGTVDTPGYDNVVCVVTRDGLPFLTQTQALVYTGSQAPFAFNTLIAAGLHDHDVLVLAQQGATMIPVAERGRIAAGDVFLIQGQSNALAGDYLDEGLGNQNQSPWVRSFGTASLQGAEVPFDLNWGMADGERGNQHATIGAWGLRMGRNLVEAYGVPIAILNGAEAATSITQHQRNDSNPDDLSTIYGRLLYRAQAAGVAGAVKAILWYQGEQDAPLFAIYQASFQALHADWMADHPNVDWTYIFQIRDGCGPGNQSLREVQRRIPDAVPGVRIMSTTAAPGHNGCHFSYAGYHELGERITRRVARDFYGSPVADNIDPPNIQSATFTSPAHDQVLLVFRDLNDGLVLEPGAESLFVVDDSVTVTGATVIGNTVTLQLSGPSSASLVAYIGRIGDGPWFTNALGVGALTFFFVPIGP